MWGAIIGAIASIASSAIGSSIANKRKAEAEKAYQDTINDQISDLNDEINSDFLNSATAQNALRKLTDSNNETLRQLNTDAIRSGASDEAKVAMASKLTKQTANAVGDLSAIGEQKKENLKAQKRNLLLNLAQHQYNQDSDTSGIDSMTSAISSAANSLGSAISAKGTTPKTTGTEASAASGAGTAVVSNAPTPPPTVGTEPKPAPNVTIINNEELKK